MQPGQACIACHGQGEGPQFEVAGTVFAGQHEQNGCFGSAGAQVVVSDADGRTLTLETNAAGNFSYRGPLTLPIHAEVRHQGATRAMAAAVPSGDCNACHTENGTQGSPGRILLP